MTISQTIKRLEELLQIEGDVEVWYYGRDESSPVERVFATEGKYGVGNRSEEEKLMRHIEIQ